MSQRDATLTRVPLTLTFDDLLPWIFKVRLYLGNGRPDCHGSKGMGVVRIPWYETLRKWVNWTLCWLGYLWPWIFKVKLYLGNGRPNCHGRKGTGVDRMPCCETQRKWVHWTLRWLVYLWPWPLTFDLEFWKSKIVSLNGWPDCHGTKGTGVDWMPWCETLRKWVNWMLCWLGYLWPWPLTLNFEGQIVSREWEAQLSWNERDGSR